MLQKRTLKIGVSACLMGMPVRYDGTAKTSADCQQLADSFEVITFCPEVGAGMGVPRPTIYLTGEIAAYQARLHHNNQDVTLALEHYSQSRRNELAQLSGCILKSRSPSCGVNSAPLVNDGQATGELVDGIFTQVIRAEFPDMPILDSDDVDDELALAQFLLKATVYGHAELCLGDFAWLPQGSDPELKIRRLLPDIYKKIETLSIDKCEQFRAQFEDGQQNNRRAER
ncbi:DUF523 domain-containing protein [Pseudidiomarina taiwanensis]|uniref:Uncharacterized protein n=1 Tax=Pseudidiomarina taiwanensis TaxID=337250 RepID=A0A432ZMY1_9GAMM|nr:DUF523 domain-containing protein [Pseudidiomarina taiwanensis]RUO79249.1 hypothetical protein CWI83_01675 [Pseudidiomarina taiwanensis]